MNQSQVIKVKQSSQQYKVQVQVLKSNRSRKQQWEDFLFFGGEMPLFFGDAALVRMPRGFEPKGRQL